MNNPPKLISKGDPAEPGSERWKLLTQAIRDWRRATLCDYGSQVCENAARELEIERDTGKIVHINTRI